MAEFCLTCYIRDCKPENVSTEYAKLTDYDDLCEGCGEYKPVVLEVTEPWTAGKILYDLNTGGWMDWVKGPSLVERLWRRFGKS